MTTGKLLLLLFLFSVCVFLAGTSIWPTTLEGHHGGRESWILSPYCSLDNNPAASAAGSLADLLTAFCYIGLPLFLVAYLGHQGRVPSSLAHLWSSLWVFVFACGVVHLVMSVEWFAAYYFPSWFWVEASAKAGMAAVSLWTAILFVSERRLLSELSRSIRSGASEVE